MNEFSHRIQTNKGPLTKLSNIKAIRHNDAYTIEDGSPIQRKYTLLIVTPCEIKSQQGNYNSLEEDMMLTINNGNNSNMPHCHPRETRLKRNNKT